MFSGSAEGLFGVFPHGFVVLNADDDRVYAMRQDLQCHIALFSLDEGNPRVRKHCYDGGTAAVFENGYLTILKGMWKIRIERVAQVPITFGGKAEFNVANALAAILAAYVHGISVEDIRIALNTFIPSPAQTPGRMNIFHFRNFTVMVDYAHNTAGLQAIGKFISKVDSPFKIGIIAGVGDRRDEDILSLGEEAGRLFDKIIIRQDRNLRGRTEDEIIQLLVQGIKNSDPDIEFEIIKSERDAIDHSLKTAPKGSFIVICSDVVPDALNQVQAYKEEEEKEFISV